LYRCYRQSRCFRLYLMYQSCHPSQKCQRNRLYLKCRLVLKSLKSRQSHLYLMYQRLRLRQKYQSFRLSLKNHPCQKTRPSR
jgi:hypothetical protein